MSGHTPEREGDGMVPVLVHKAERPASHVTEVYDEAGALKSVTIDPFFVGARVEARGYLLGPLTDAPTRWVEVVGTLTAYWSGYDDGDFGWTPHGAEITTADGLVYGVDTDSMSIVDDEPEIQAWPGDDPSPADGAPATTPAPSAGTTNPASVPAFDVTVGLPTLVAVPRQAKRHMTVDDVTALANARVLDAVRDGLDEAHREEADVSARELAALRALADVARHEVHAGATDRRRAAPASSYTSAWPRRRRAVRREDVELR
ncbi:MAG: hypothetical protein FWF90_11530 [Promicromonosporaceae bacterium]|nr:hypothetical protein [Promicromonosporaceae bacterium]